MIMTNVLRNDAKTFLNYISVTISANIETMLIFTFSEILSYPSINIKVNVTKKHNNNISKFHLIHYNFACLLSIMCNIYYFISEMWTQDCDKYLIK